MFDTLRKILYFKKLDILWYRGVKEKRIVPFDEGFYEKMSRTYFGCLPVSMNIKYLKSITSPGKCFDRSLMMFCCFDNALLVNADIKSLELNGGKDNAWHYWIEIGDYVYDPTIRQRIDKDLYYEMYQPTNVSKCTKEEYCKDEVGRELYDDITKTTIDDYLPNGKKRYELMAIIPLVVGIAEMTGNVEFMTELNEWLSLIQYDTKAIKEEVIEKSRMYFETKQSAEQMVTIKKIPSI